MLKHIQIGSKLRSCLLLSVVLLLGACSATNSSRSGVFEAYRQDLPQGNYITQEMLAQVKTGMTQEQVKFALGAPLLVNIFQPDRWNYVFRYQHAGGKVDLRRLVIYFNAANQVARMEGDDLPAAEDGSDAFLPGNRTRAKK